MAKTGFAGSRVHASKSRWTSRSSGWPGSRPPFQPRSGWVSCPPGSRRRARLRVGAAPARAP